MFTLRLFLALTTMMTVNCEIFTADFDTPFEFKFIDKTNSPVKKDSIVEPTADRKQLTKSCSQSEGLILSGDFVKLSDFVEFNGSFGNECQAKLVIILASRKLIIDRDLAVTDNELRVTIIAPKWLVSGFRKLDLEVETFLGISETIINEENLIITSNGGKSKLNKIIKLGTGTFGTATFDTEIRALKRRKGEVKREVLPPRNSYVINRFKTFLRKQSANKFQRKQILKLYDVLSKHEKIRRFYSAISLVNEFDGLENQFFSEKKSNSKMIDFYPFYQFLLRGIVQYANDSTSSENSPDHIKMYRFLYTAALSKMTVIRNNTEPNLIVDISAYMDMVVKKFEQLNQISTAFNKTITIEKYNAEYKERFETKITEAMNFIKYEITPEIDKIDKLLNTQIEQLVNETQIEIDKAKNEKEKALETQRKMEENMVLGKITSVLKGASLLVSFLGPVGSAVGAVTGAATAITESILIHDVTADQLAAVPDAVQDGFSQIGNLMNNLKENQINKLNQIMEFTQTKLDDIGEKDEFSGPRNVMTDNKAKIKELENSVDYDPKIVKKLEENLRSSMEKEIADLEAKIKNTEDKKSRNAERLAKVSAIVVGISSTTIDIISRVKDDEKNLAAASEAVKAADKKLKDLQNYEDEIYDFLIPMKNAMFANANKLSGKLENISRSALDVEQWKVQSTLKDIQLNLRKATAGFKVGDFIVRSAEKLEEALTTIINVYGRIENYEADKQLIDYLKNIASELASTKVIKDDKLNTAVKKLEIVIKSNVLINEYDLTLRALEQWLFPFADLCLGHLQLPEGVFDSGNSATLDVIIANTRAKVNDMSDQLTNYKSATKSFDRFIIKAQLSRFVPAYFEWSNQRFKEEISDILRGKVTWLWADIAASDKKKDAIKFKEIRFNFRTKNISAQNVLNEILNGFKIQATHSGNSYYRFSNQIYVFNCESQTIDYTFRNGVDGNPVETNVVYDKIKDGILMLSPYTMWKIKLVEKKGKFEQLKPFINDVSIELSGSGTHVEDYFQVTDSMSRYRLY